MLHIEEDIKLEKKSEGLIHKFILKVLGSPWWQPEQLPIHQEWILRSFETTTLVPEARYPDKWENIILKNENCLRHPETGLWSHQPGTSFPRKKSVQELNRVVDWFDKNNNNCDWIVKTAASRGTQNRFLSRNKLLWWAKKIAIQLSFLSKCSAIRVRFQV